MNVYDSVRMADALAPAGFTAVTTPELADLVILNTCHIRERAADKLFSELGRLRVLQADRARAGGRMMLAVAGCVAQAQGREILARAPYVDIVLGPQVYHRLPALVAAAAAGPVIDTDMPNESKFDFLPEAASPQGVVSFLSIQEGCDKFCAFCVVPYTRGAEASRPAPSVIAEARRMVASGTREIALLGQNVNAYHGTAADTGTWDLARLLRALADIPELLRLRYTTSHPCDMTPDLIAAHRDNPVLLPFLHLPVQSGSDAMLRAMNRRHTAADYLRVIDALRDARPDLALSSDFITGHPGETDADFEATLALVRRVGFASAYTFAYSPRPGTPAASWPQVPEPVRMDRLRTLQALIRAQTERFNGGTVGAVLPVLWTGSGRHPGQVAGRTPYLQPVHMTGPAAPGTMTVVRIDRAHPNSLSAQPIAAAASASSPFEQEKITA